jgi:hypothetical protein
VLRCFTAVAERQWLVSALHSVVVCFCHAGAVDGCVCLQQHVLALIFLLRCTMVCVLPDACVLARCQQQACAGLGCTPLSPERLHSRTYYMACALFGDDAWCVRAIHTLWRAELLNSWALWRHASCWSPSVLAWVGVCTLQCLQFVLCGWPLSLVYYFCYQVCF